MTRPTRNLVMAAAFGLLLVGCSGGGSSETSESNAPSTDSATVGGGEKVTLASLAKDGPAILYFAKQDCGSNPRAVPLVESVYKAYAGKARMFAVVNTSAEGYREWSERFGTSMEGIPDEDLALTRELGFSESQHLVMLDKDGKTREIDGGFGRDALVALNKALAAEAGQDPVEVDLSGAPDRAAYG